MLDDIEGVGVTNLNLVHAVKILGLSLSNCCLLLVLSFVYLTSNWLRGAGSNSERRGRLPN